MTGREWGLMGVLAILWGVSFFFSKVALAELPPFTLVLGRFGIAALALLLAARLGGHRIPRSRRLWAGFFVLGALNSFIPFGLIAWGQVQLTSGLASILNATTPLFTALVAATAWGDERLTSHRLAGVLIGLAGVCVLIGPGALGHLGAHTLAELAILGAAVSYAFAGTYGRRFRALPPVVAVAGMMTTAALMALPVALVVDRPWTLDVGTRTWGALLGLALVSTALGFVICPVVGTRYRLVRPSSKSPPGDECVNTCSNEPLAPSMCSRTLSSVSALLFLSVTTTARILRKN